jgi:hypothetical protein
MSTIRRLYLYAVAFISLMVITWGLIGLARSAFAGDQIGNDVTRLAGALALIFVGIPVFLLHWWLAQRGANQDEEERFSYIRAIFLYGALLATLIPIIQNLTALVNRIFFTLFNLSDNRMMFGSDQIWSDNLIAMLMNGLIAAYLFSVLRKDWAAEPTSTAYAETRRLYRFIWMLYGLTMLVGGVQQTLLYLFDSLENAAIASQSILANGLTLIIIGTPTWIISWRILQKAGGEQAEQESLMRAVTLFIVNLISMVATLFAGGALLNILIQIILGERLSFAGLMGELRDPMSVVIPFGVAWAYFSRIRRQDLSASEVNHQQPNRVQEVYEYLAAFLGLITFFIGLQQLAFFTTSLLVEQPIWTNIYRERLSVALSELLIGLPLWLLNWRKVNNVTKQVGDEENHLERSLIRRFYLYLVLFISVIGVMISAGMLIFEGLQAVLGDPDENLLQTVLELVSLLILFTLVIWYHALILRSDGRSSAQIQEKLQAEFPILVLVSEFGDFSEMLVAALSKEAPTMPVAVHNIELGVPDEGLSDARAVILPANIAANPGEAIRLWLQNFPGVRFVIPTAVQGWVWVSGGDDKIQNLVRQTAEMVRKLAEGEELRQSRSSSPWLIFGYIMGGLLGLIFLLIAASTLIDLLT